jgi:hypothetical protein
MTKCLLKTRQPFIIQTSRGKGILVLTYITAQFTIYQLAIIFYKSHLRAWFLCLIAFCSKVKTNESGIIPAHLFPHSVCSFLSSATSL